MQQERPLRLDRLNLLSSSFLLACFLFAGTLSLFWLGYRATVEWDISTQQSVQSRGREILALLSAAIDKDMKGGQLDLLLPINGAILKQSSLYDLADRFAGALARFPYIESVYVWNLSRHSNGELYFFNRTERVPPWDEESPSSDWYPVNVRANPVKPSSLVVESGSNAENAMPYSVTEGAIGGAPYQVVAHRIFADDGAIESVVGFTVNLEWVRDHYFGALIDQVQRIGSEGSVRLEVRDGVNKVVAGVGPSASGESFAPHLFPLVFADRSLASGIGLPAVPMWSARVDVAADPTLITAKRSRVRTLTLLSAAVAATIIALLLAVRSVRLAASLAGRQADFVSAVSHEMKTPLSLITLAGDSLASGRCASPEAARDYGRLLAGEARELSMLIDNVLCYARLIDKDDSTTLEPVDLADVLGESVERFRVRCAEMGCDIQLESQLASELVQADRRMLRDTFDNIVDNAIKYGGKGGRIVIALQVQDSMICADVTDFGDGIADEDLAHVFEKFRRGREVTHQHRGSGLGLTIARRVVEAHRGRITLSSRIGYGTTVHVELPLCRG
jgi:signal transduction histidine kinase